MAIDHDQIFKTLFKSFFQEFMELFLPEQAAVIDFSNIEFFEQELFTDVAGGRRKQLDLVVRVGLRRGGEEYVLVHTEFQAKKDPELPQRMYEYFSQLFLRHKKTIVPVVVFTDDAIWRKMIPDTYEIGLRGRIYMSFRYHQVKLRHLDYRQFLGSSNPLAFALMAKMKYNRPQRVRLKADFLRLILGVQINPARQGLLLEFVETYMALNREEEAELGRLVTQRAEFKEVAKMVTTYEKRGLERGLKKGIEKGIEKGLLQGKREFLILQLEKRFGELDGSAQSKIRRIHSLKRLESLAINLLDAESIEELGL